MSINRNLQLVCSAGNIAIAEYRFSFWSLDDVVSDVSSSAILEFIAQTEIIA